jgi:hypothetical protein
MDNSDYSHGVLTQFSKLFVYGSLKPGELGFEQIEKFVSHHCPAELLNCALYVRDGLPVVKSSVLGESVSGALLQIKEGGEREFWEIVTSYEGTTNYKLEEMLPVIAEGKEIQVAVFIGKKMTKGNPERLYLPWTSTLNPIFSQSFPLLHREIDRNALKFTDLEYNPADYWAQMNKLLSQYLLLVSILEHLTVVKFGGSKKQEPMERIRKFHESDGYAKAFQALTTERYNPLIKVSDSRAVETLISSTNPRQALLAWYQVRSNLQHRGKASVFDAELVHKSCIGLGNFLLEYLAMHVKGIQDEWQRLLGENLTKNEFKEGH